MKDFSAIQQQLSRHLRHPGEHLPPQGVEDRRLEIYRDLIYNNIEGFIAGGFPVLREITDDRRWHAMVRDFIYRHRSASPYFLEISQEFLQYLQSERIRDSAEPDFLLELAHYEWVELALDVAQGELPPFNNNTDVLASPLEVSPLLWCLSYCYPVHKIGPDYQPQSPPDDPTFLLVYRNRADHVEFMLSNAVTVRLIKLLQESTCTGTMALGQLAQEMQHPQPEQLVVQGESLLQDLHRRDILWPVFAAP